MNISSSEVIVFVYWILTVDVEIWVQILETFKMFPFKFACITL